MKPPPVSRQFLTRQLQGTRQPTGLLANALPQFYLAQQDGALLVMQDKSKSPDGATGPQVCLATISPQTLAALLASKQPMELKP